MRSLKKVDLLQCILLHGLKHRRDHGMQAMEDCLNLNGLFFLDLRPAKTALESLYDRDMPFAALKRNYVHALAR
jgi:hypothetical protein